MSNSMNMVIGLAVVCCSSLCVMSVMNSGAGGLFVGIGDLLGGATGGAADGADIVGDLLQGKTPDHGNTIEEVDPDSDAAGLFNAIELTPCKQCVNSDFTTYPGAGTMIPAGTCGQGSIPTTVEHCTQLFADQGKYIKQKEKKGKSVYYLSDTP